MRHLHPLASTRLATALHPAGALALVLFGGPAAAVFTVLHGAAKACSPFAKGTLPLALSGPAGYGLRNGLLSVLPASRRPARRSPSGCCSTAPASACWPSPRGCVLLRRPRCSRFGQGVIHGRS
jgi:hypothetical protein